jgi:hypothetical protein
MSEEQTPYISQPPRRSNDEIARTVADRLFLELKAGKRAKIGYDDIRVALLAERFHHDSFNQVAELTLRRFVEKCA